MNSKQLNFFHSNNEINKFIFFFKEKGFKLCPYLINDLEEIDKENNLFNQNRVEIIFDSSKLEYKFIDKQNYYLVNTEKSYVVEFLFSSFLEENKIESGRLYFTTRYYENQNYNSKNLSFINEADKLLKEFKKIFLKKTKYSKNWFFTEEINNLFEKELAEWTQNNNVILLK